MFYVHVKILLTWVNLTWKYKR